MRAAYYTKEGTAAAVLHVGTVAAIEPGPDEVQLEVYYSGINPGEIGKGVLQPGAPMPYPFIIPHSDGAGIVRQVGSHVSAEWLGKKVLCFGAQSYRAYGTAAEYCSVPLTNVVALTANTLLVQAAQMGIPAMTGYVAVHKAGNPTGKTILVQGGAGAVAQCAIQFAKRAGAVVLATVTKPEDVATARNAGAAEVFVLHAETSAEIKKKYPEGIDHVVEVSFAANLEMNLSLLKNRGSIATYASSFSAPQLPFWPLVFNNISLHFLGSDDFSMEDKRASMEQAVQALDAGWAGLEIAEVMPLEDIRQAHTLVANRKSTNRVVLRIKA